ncbi:PREDICTED: Meckel syndrome type 1 protein-like [Nicrophorus vespilloides]|uniref:Meckel syndrome type 1 protein-like n=1 Tax=Nicrophorus vespilloides TaxID=110193 RepID=A0ABM1N560_NICVS|nr:PREDICTED: Meckel syndrome type 1 protein-like [Nicrophorus vespilloides]
MIEIEETTKRFSRVYSCPDEIRNFQIRIRLEDGENEEVKVLRWQEKKFSKFERELYNDSKKCLSDLEKSYHEQVKNTMDSNDVVFTYTGDDEYESEDNLLFEVGDAAKFGEGYDFEMSLMSSMATPHLERDIEHMQIMADFGEYFEETWLKREYLLCRLCYSKNTKSLTVFPDFTKTNPYVLSVNADSSRKIKYWLENSSETSKADAEIISAVVLHEAKVRRDILAGKLSSFKCIVEEGKLQAHVFLEILRGKDFEGSDVYVRFFVELPEGWTSDDQLDGVTQASANRNDVSHFGFPFEFTLDHHRISEGGDGFASPKIYFEVMSKSSWSRFGSEGFAYSAIPIWSPGQHEFRLACIRVGPNSTRSNLRRFFVGDGFTCKDPTWVGVPSDHQGKVMNKFGTDSVCGGGELEVRMSIMMQRNAREVGGVRGMDETGTSRLRFLVDRLDSPGLVESVEKVVRAFQNARKNMLKARTKI